MSSETITVEADAATAATRESIPGHAHHWLIDAADGPRSAGWCKHCGLQSTFSNSTQAATWERGPSREPEIAALRRERARQHEDFMLSDEAA